MDNKKPNTPEGLDEELERRYPLYHEQDVRASWNAEIRQQRKDFTDGVIWALEQGFVDTEAVVRNYKKLPDDGYAMIELGINEIECFKVAREDDVIVQIRKKED